MSIRMRAIKDERVYDNPGFHQAISVDGAQSLLSISGQVPIDANGATLHKGDFSGQTRVVLDAIRALVTSGGSSLDSVIKLNVYVTDVQRRIEFAKIREEYFRPPLPPITMIGVSALVHPDWEIEIDALAVF